MSNLLAFGPSTALALADAGAGGGQGGGARPLSKKMEEAFQGWTSHGQAYFRQMLAHLKRSQTDAFSETNAFLVRARARVRVGVRVRVRARARAG